MHQSELATWGQRLWAFWKEDRPPYLPYQSAACFCWATPPDRSGQHCKEHFSCSMRSLAFLLPPKLSSALLVTGINWYHMSSCMRLQRSRAFCPVAAKSIFAKTDRVESKLLGRFAPSPQCLTVLTYLSQPAAPTQDTWQSCQSSPGETWQWDSPEAESERDMLCLDTGKILQFEALKYFRIYTRPAIQLNSSIQFLFNCAKSLHFYTTEAVLFLEVEN